MKYSSTSETFGKNFQNFLEKKPLDVAGGKQATPPSETQ